MALTAEMIYGFTNTLLLSGFDNPKPTPKVHREMWDRCTSDSQFVSIAAPRGHAKSTAITHSYSLASLCFRESQYMVIVSDTEGQAALFLSDIKKEVIENEELKTLFGIRGLRKDTETVAIVEFIDGRLARIEAKGSEQKVRGLKWRGMRPDLIVGDDLENDEIVLNEERRAKFRRWMNNALLPALADHGKVRIVGTILHLDSFLENTMPPFEDPATTTDGIRWWSTDEDRVWNSVRYQGHSDDFSQLLWPEKFSRKRYETIRRRYVEAGNPEGYAQEYLNYPIDEQTAYFKKKDFLEWDNHDEYLEYYVGGDLAISQKEQRAFTVFVVVGLNRAGDLVVVDVERFRGDGLDIINTMFRLQKIYSPEIFFLEEENIARSIGPFLDQEMIARGVYLTIEPQIPTQDKVKRARGIQARMRAGTVRFDTRKDWYASLYTEMVTFPRGKYVDQVDALSWVGLGLNKIVPTYTSRELAQFEYDEEVSTFVDNYDLGRNTITGY